MGVGRECNFCDFMDEASKISQGVYPFFQTHKASRDRAITVYCSYDGMQILFSCHTPLCQGLYLIPQMCCVSYEVYTENV